jgi:hypothetical protein
VLPLADYAIDVPRARQLEECHAALVDVIDVANSRFHARRDPKEFGLAFDQRNTSQIIPIQRDQIEGVEERRSAAIEQPTKVGAAIRIESHDFAIQDGRFAAGRMRQPVSKIKPLPELEAIARDEATAAVLDVRAGSKAVPLHFPQPVFVIEGLWQTNQLHRWLWHDPEIMPRAFVRL